MYRVKAVNLRGECIAVMESIDELLVEETITDWAEQGYYVVTEVLETPAFLADQGHFFYEEYTIH